MSEKRGRHKPPPGLTEEERRKWWENQRRKFVWGPGDVVITREGGGERPEGEDDEDERPGH